MKSISILATTLPWIFVALTAHADIVGGDEVKEQDPISKSIAAFYEPSADGRGGALCTASLIGKDTAVTAAHCISPHGSRPVLIFGNDVRSAEASKRPVTAVAVNPKWRTHQGKGMDQGDIALVKFPGGLPPGYQTVPTLPANTPIQEGTDTILAGYGISDARRKSGSGVLRKTSVRVENPRPGKSEMILDQSHGHGACHGDSGGPAFVNVAGRTVLAGVTNRSYPNSAPDDCAHKVVYTKVSAYQPWIKKTQAKFHPDHYASQAARKGPRAPRTLKSIKARVRRKLHPRARVHRERPLGYRHARAHRRS